MLNENHITELLATYVIKKKFDIVGKLTTVQKGIDLVVRDKKGVSTYIEIKGETSASINSKRYGSDLRPTRLITMLAWHCLQPLRQ